MKKIIAGSAIICILIIIGVSYTFIPRKINEEYNVYIFSKKDMPMKEVPITLKGKLYKRIMQNDIFIGTIEVEGEIVEIKSSEGDHSDLDNNKYYYTYNTDNSSSKGMTKHEASVVFSKDFDEIYGYTSGLREKYGEMSIFKSNTELKTIYDKYLD
ncbi:MAG: hypothetical protein N2645_04620 [Clostridia bacterium]|nr:hypothetical protein [Clostridia bacterium]